MRLQYALVSLLVALACAERIGVRDGLRLRQAQQSGTPATTTNNAPSTSATSDNTEPSNGPTSTGSASQAATTGDSHSVSPSKSGDATVPITLSGTTTGSPSPTVTLPGPNNSTNDGVTLPIQPALNPALGIAGVLLMIAGLALGFVGIKHRETQTFLSTALVVALSIEVLVVYLMHPPVPAAIQGAYLVAGVCGGALLGGLALIFKEVSEGFGCVLGGFCLAMWLLVLRPGGLIQNSTGKIVLIAVLCAAGYCSYISRFTRDYGVIVCTSFAGATAFILGIDCFGRAGLKEFWLYIWDLNDNEFPLFTDTYPITRNMRVEIAAIIIVAFLGTMSQIKIWKIVKEQKAKRDAQRILDEEARDALEEEVGRDVENRNRESLAHWEEYHDGKKQPQVSVESGTASIDEYNNKDYDTESKSGSQSYPLVNVRSAQSNHRSSSSVNQDNRRYTLPIELDEDGRPMENGNLETASQAGTATNPFTSRDNLNEVAGRDNLTDVTSYKGTNEGVAATLKTEPASPGFLSQDPMAAVKRPANVKRLSMKSLHAKHALEAANEEPFIEEEDEIASSIAATAAEPPDADALSTRLSRPNSMYLSHGARNSTVTLQLNNEEIIEDDDEEALYPAPKSPRHLDPNSPGTPASNDRKSEAGDGYFDGAEKSELAERLPKRISKAATTYRTNEWAKEVSRAEPEPIEEELEPDAEAVQIEMGNAAESARADENNAAPAPPPPPPQPKIEQKAEQKTEKKRSSNRLSQRISRTLTPVYSHQAKPSDDSWSIPLAKRASSNPVLNVEAQEPQAPALEPSRNVSAPVLDQRVVESPVNTTLPDKARQVSQLMRRQSNLLDERRDRLDNRLTTTSFMTPSASTPPLLEEDLTRGGESSQEGSQADHASSSGKNEEDMTLAQRKALVQQQQQVMQEGEDTIRPMNSRHVSQTISHLNMPTPAASPPPPFQRSPSGLSMTKPIRMSSAGPSKPIYDSHQPHRTSSHNANKQAQNWSMWRSSNAVANTSRQPILYSDSQMEMLRAARMQRENEARAKEEQKRAKQEQIDAHMRMGGMNDAHRAAIARMQGEANKKAL
ncbi:Hypothetical predicted protein [Lecanosticta acicola]|uniref:TM7S3/TM198-like domain-containing protein n=1 Tax=Lecanosticta acicola TaxID=111012 RepID=A0AAI8YVX0_9PEZI|nr:Hypothetical predicted protein [Lecanosticta acicola]